MASRRAVHNRFNRNSKVAFIDSTRNIHEVQAKKRRAQGVKQENKAPQEIVLLGRREPRWGSNGALGERSLGRWKGGSQCLGAGG